MDPGCEADCLHQSPWTNFSYTCVQDKALLDNFSKMMNHLIFTGLEKRP